LCVKGVGATTFGLPTQKYPGDDNIEGILGTGRQVKKRAFMRLSRETINRRKAKGSYRQNLRVGISPFGVRGKEEK